MLVYFNMRQITRMYSLYEPKRFSVIQGFFDAMLNIYISCKLTIIYQKEISLIFLIFTNSMPM